MNSDYSFFTWIYSEEKRFHLNILPSVTFKVIVAIQNLNAISDREQIRLKVAFKSFKILQQDFQPCITPQIYSKAGK